MNFSFLFALLAVAAPLVASRYSDRAPPSYSSANSIQEITNVASGGSRAIAQEIEARAEAQPTPIESARIGNAQTQVEALQSNPTYNNVKNSEDIAESLATSQLSSNIRDGKVNFVPPNLVEQDVHRSLLVPTGQNNYQVITTQPLPSIVVTQPGAPPQSVSSGPAAVVRAAPVIYKMRPSIIYQQEVINKIPTPLSLNPVYVKVYKPGKQLNVPTAPVVQPSYQNSYPAAASESYNAAPPAYGAPSLAYAEPAYSAPDSASYSAPSQPSYSGASAPNYSASSAPAYNAPSAQAYSPPSPPAYNTPSAPEYNAPAAPAYSAAASPAYNSGAPAYRESSRYALPNYQQGSY